MMRKIVCIFSLIIFWMSTSAQNTWEIYNNTYGIPDIMPSKTIKSNDFGEIDVYNNTYRIPDIIPSTTTKSNNYGGFKDPI